VNRERGLLFWRFAFLRLWVLSNGKQNKINSRSYSRLTILAKSCEIIIFVNNGIFIKMIINQKKCVACGNCVAICPMGAIYVDQTKNRAMINDDACVECGTCYRGMSTENLNPVMVRTIRKVAKFFRFRFEPEPDVCPTGSFLILWWNTNRLVSRVGALKK